jgi:2-polyprenyl-3-methyl-5-hydroxy-6-metoxy-1,4-benzoquinol methylase
VSQINKTMDRDDLGEPAAREVCTQLNRLVHELDERGLRASHWYGELEMPPQALGWERANRGFDYEPLTGAADDDRFPWFLYWEIAWLALHNDFQPGQRLLDLGGSSSLFSYWAASRGVDVLTVDLKQALVDNANAVAANMGWNLRNLAMDIRDLEIAERFDHITSVCVFEHIPMHDRVEINAHLRDLLVDGGSLSLTFDYLNPSRLARISSPADVNEQFVAPSGLRVRGNEAFHDNFKRYLLHPFHHPKAHHSGWKAACIARGQFGPEQVAEVADANEYTFGALFLKR